MVVSHLKPSPAASQNAELEAEEILEPDHYDMGCGWTKQYLIVDFILLERKLQTHKHRERRGGERERQKR